jgi:peptidoglycan/LPS O-acetylase OafA/YrhL
VREHQFHIPSLDGVRGLAAFMVFLSHCGLESVIPGGFGVTLFFFLSGYLITTLLRNEHEATGDVSLKRFYLRRVFRIFPPLYIVLTILVVLASLGIARNEMTLGAIIAQYAQLTNYYMIFADGANLVAYTGPMWSLSVEEHFYLLFPLLLLLLWRAGRNPRQIAAFLVGVCIAVLAWRCYLIFVAGATDLHTYRATDTRIDSLLFGCIMGIWSNPALDSEKDRLGRKGWIPILIASTALLILTFVVRDVAFRETFRYSLQGCALFAIFYCAVRFHNWPIFSWLDSAPMRGMGLISYTFYLSHLACLRLVERHTDLNAWVIGVLGFILAVGFSTALYFLVERHMGALRRKLHTSPDKRATRPAPLSKHVAQE